MARRHPWLRMSAMGWARGYGKSAPCALLSLMYRAANFRNPPSPFFMRHGAKLGWNHRWFQGFLEKVIGLLPSGPGEQERKRGCTKVWAQAIDGEGKRSEVVLYGPEAYDFTAATAAKAMLLAARGQVKAGYQTPAAVFGTQWLLELEGIELEVRL